jgi:hypothetical protein
MKNNFGLYFHILFGVITFVLGLYFLKNLIFLSLLFFIATIVNILLLFKEYQILVSPKKNMKLLEIQEELQIKKSKSISFVTSLSYLVFIIICIFFLSLLLKDQPENLIMIAISIGALLFSITMLFLEIRKMNSVIIRINKKGIQTYQKPLMNWNDIENEKIIFRTFRAKESKHDFSGEINYLHFYFKNEKIEIEINDLDISESELNHYLKMYRESFNELKQKLA